jgi:peptide/nickel transport system permease protein
MPIYIQYLHWIGGILHGDFGLDYRSDQPIRQLILSTLPVTGELVVLSLLLGIVIGVPLGTAAAVWRNRIPDRVGQIVSMFGISVPDFWLAIILVLLFSLAFRLFPSSGFVPPGEDLARNLWHLFLPALALASGLAAVLIRITRAAMLSVLEQDFIKYARSSGLSEWSVILRHGLRNAAVPVITVIGLQAGYLFGATVVIEEVFSLPGLGRLVLESTLARNYPLIQASVLVLGFLFVVVNLVVDVVYLLLDPRLRTSTT